MKRDRTAIHGAVPEVGVSRGVATLLRLLREETFDLREVDLEGFRNWLDAHLSRWRRDPVFVQRSKIRELRAGCPELRVVEKERRRAVRLDAESAAYSRLSRLERDLAGAAQAVAGLSAAVKQASGAKRVDLAAKLRGFRVRRRALAAEQAALIRSSAERRALARVDRKVRRLRVVIGLDEEEAELGRLLKERGRRGGRSGVSFERTAEEVIRREVMPELLRGNGPGAAERVRVLRGVKLGAAGVEFDLLVVRATGNEVPVEVLAAVETKRNVNDLAHGFRRRQIDLAWLTGETTDVAGFRTKTYPAGRFDRVAFHEQEEETFAFDGRSFRRFERDPETRAFVRRLYFVTQPGPLWGVSSAVLSRIGHRLATDERVGLDDERSLQAISDWCRSLCEPLEAPEVLRLYASDTNTARSILFVE